MAKKQMLSVGVLMAISPVAVEALCAGLQPARAARCLAGTPWAEKAPADQVLGGTTKEDCCQEPTRKCSSFTGPTSGCTVASRPIHKTDFLCLNLVTADEICIEATCCEGAWEDLQLVRDNIRRVEDDFQGLPATADCSPHGSTTQTMIDVVGTGPQAKSTLGMTNFLHWVEHNNPSTVQRPQREREVSNLAWQAWKKVNHGQTGADAMEVDADEWKKLIKILRPTREGGMTWWAQGNVAIPTIQEFENSFLSATARHSISRTQFANWIGTNVGNNPMIQLKTTKAFDKADSKPAPSGDGRLDRDEWNDFLDQQGLKGIGADGLRAWADKSVLPSSNLPEVSCAATVATCTRIDQFDPPAIAGNREVDAREFARWGAELMTGSTSTWKPHTLTKANTIWANANKELTVTPDSLSKREVWELMRQTRIDEAREKARRMFEPTDAVEWVKHIVPPSSGDWDGNNDGRVSMTELVTWAAANSVPTALLSQIVNKFDEIAEGGSLDREGMQRLGVLLAPRDGEVVEGKERTDDSIPSKCKFTTGVDYMGHDLKAFPSLGSAEACQLRCARVAGAKFFQFMPVVNSKPSVCWCKSSDVGAINKEHRVVGPVKCLPGGGPDLGSGGPDRFVGAWESRVVDAPTNSVAIVGTVMGTGALAMALVLWVASKRFGGRSQQMVPEAVPFEVQE